MCNCTKQKFATIINKKCLRNFRGLGRAHHCVLIHLLHVIKVNMMKSRGQQSFAQSQKPNPQFHQLLTVVGGLATSNSLQSPCVVHNPKTSFSHLLYCITLEWPCQLHSISMKLKHGLNKHVLVLWIQIFNAKMTLPTSIELAQFHHLAGVGGEYK